MTLTQALMKALGCRPGAFRRTCSLHYMGWDEELDECKRAQHAAEKLAPLLSEVEQ